MIAVLLLAYGGPGSLEEVEPFVKSLTGKKELPAEMINSLKARYRTIGGSSPLPGITAQLAELLEKELNKKENNFKVYFGFRHSSPTIEEAAKKISESGTRNVIAVNLSPYYSKFVHREYIEEFNRVIEKTGANVSVSFIKSLADDKIYLELIARNIAGKIREIARENKIYLIFTAHSIPEKYIEQGDNYLEQIKKSIKLIIEFLAEELSKNNLVLPAWELAFQSCGMGGGKWLGPGTDEVIRILPAKGYRNVLLVPISFLADNIEILYDIDIVFKKIAEENNINLERTESLNISSGLVKVLENIVLEQTKK